MRKYILTLLGAAIVCSQQPATAQDDPGFKTSIDITVDEIGDAVCEFKTKYNAAWWDYFTKTVGNNTSILKNNIKKTFPKYELTDFDYKQDSDDRTNTIKFKIFGMASIDKNGKWLAELDQKNPDITKISERDFLLIESGNSLKIHLPSGTTGARIEKDSFGEAILTYPATEAAGVGTYFLIAGIILMAAGGFLLFKNMRKPKLRTIYDHTKTRESLPTAAHTQISPAEVQVEKITPAASPASNLDFRQDSHA